MKASIVSAANSGSASRQKQPKERREIKTLIGRRDNSQEHGSLASSSNALHDKLVKQFKNEPIGQKTFTAVRLNNTSGGVEGQAKIDKRKQF